MKPLKFLGSSQKDLRAMPADVRYEHGLVMYVAKFADAIYVLHAFQKKTQKTTKADVGLAAKRYKMIGA